MALIDEIYEDLDLKQLFRETAQITENSGQLFCAVINGSNFNARRGIYDFRVPSTFPDEGSSEKEWVNRVYLRKLYRNPMQISKLCTKIRRQLDDEPYYMFGERESLPWAMSIDNGLDVRRRKQSISFVSRQNFKFMKEESLEGKSIAMVEVEGKEESIKFPLNAQVDVFQIHNLENADIASFEFTGVEFDVVYISFSKIGHDIKRFEKVKLILYNAMSRSTDSVTVLFHERDWAFFDELEKNTGMDFVLDKLSKSKLLTEIDLEQIDSSSEALQAIKTIIINKNLRQFKTFIPVIGKFEIEEAYFQDSAQNLLGFCFTWCKKGNILEMLRLFLSEAKQEISEEVGWKYLSQSLCFVDIHWNQTLRREFLTKFLEVTQLSIESFNRKFSFEPLFEELYFSNCWIAESEYLLHSLRNSQPPGKLLGFIASLAKFHFNENYFKKIFTILIGEKMISAYTLILEHFGVKSKFEGIVQEENLCSFFDLMEKSTLKMFTGLSFDFPKPLTFEYFQRKPFGLFEMVFMRIRKANIRLSEIYDGEFNNILWYTGWGDCGYKKAQLILQDASKQKNDELEKLLTHRNRYKESALSVICEQSRDPRIVELILWYSTLFLDNEFLQIGQPLIHSPCIGNQIAVLENMLQFDKKRGYKMTKTTNNNGMVCIHWACFGGYTTIVKMLLNTVPELALKTDKRGRNALHFACNGGHLDTAQTLYKHYCEEGLCNLNHDENSKEQSSLLYAVELEKLNVQNEQDCSLKLRKADRKTKSRLVLFEQAGRPHCSSQASNSEETDSTLSFLSREKHSHKKTKSESTGTLRQQSDYLWSVDKNGYNTLHFAALSGKLELVNWLTSLDTGLLFSLNNDGENALHIACAKGHTVLVKRCLERHPNLLQCADGRGNNLLHLSVISGNKDLVKWIYTLQTTLLFRLNNDKQNALHIACEKGHTVLVQRCLELHPNLLKCADGRGNNLLHLAVISGNMDLVKWIFSLETTLLYSLNNDKQNALHIACKKGHTVLVQRCLKLHPNLLQCADGRGNNLLHLSVISGNKDLVKWIYTLQTTLLFRLNNDKQNALHIACEKGHTVLVQRCLELYPNLLKCADGRGNNILHLSVISGNMDLVKWIYILETTLSYSLNNNKQNPLHIACEKGHLVSAMRFLEIDPSLLYSTDGRGNNILQLAVISGNMELVKWIYKLETTLLYSLNNDQLNALHIACEKGHLVSAMWFLELDPNLLQCTDGRGNGILHLAVISGNMDLVQWILRLDASP